MTASGVDWSQGFLSIVRKRATDSSRRFTEGSSTKVRLYSASEAMKMMEATFSKQWILRWEECCTNWRNKRCDLLTQELGSNQKNGKSEFAPFSPLAPLSSDIDKSEVDVAEGENCFRNTACSSPHPEHSYFLSPHPRRIHISHKV